MKLLTLLSSSFVPAVIAICALLLLTSKKPLFDAFMRGARRGFETTVELFPTLCILMCALSMLTASGVSEAISSLLELLGVPEGLGVFLAARPVSGAASSAGLSEIFAVSGVDSAAGIAASIIYASTDTLFYVVSVYCGSVGIKRTRGVIPAALAAMLTVTVAAILAARVYVS